MENCPNVYKKARNEASMTLEAAAEALAVSVSSLKDYESYSRIPPTSVVECMVVAYNSLALAYQHLRILSGNIQIIPDVQVRDLPTAAIRLYNRFVAFSRQNRGQELLEIAEDGCISQEELPLYMEIIGELKELYQASVEMELASGKA